MRKEVEMSPKPLSVSFDLDGVVFMDQAPEFIVFMKEQCSLPFNDEVFARTHSWKDALGLEVPQINQLFSSFAVQGPRPRFVPGAEEGLRAISRGAILHVNTARHRDALAIALAMLGEARILVHYAHGGMSRSKFRPLCQYGIPLHVEDSDEDIRLIVEECNAQVIQFPSYVPGSAVSPICHERVHVLPSFHKKESLSQEEVLQGCWTELMEHLVMDHLMPYSN